jgi:uncharacterized protein (DUF983 family)
MVEEPSRPIDMAAVLRCRCPRCKHAGILTKAVRSVDACTHCGLDLALQDAGDGPAFFAITVVGFLVTLLATVVELRYSPAYWIHAGLWLPLIFLLSIGMLRLIKSYLIHLEYRLALLQESDEHTRIH